jgi:hypothetical protein
VLALCPLGAIVIVVPVVFVAVVTAARSVDGPPSTVRAGIAVDRLPPLAKCMLPLVANRVGEKCPELSVPRPRTRTSTTLAGARSRTRPRPGA